MKHSIFFIAESTVHYKYNWNCDLCIQMLPIHQCHCCSINNVFLFVLNAVLNVAHTSFVLLKMWSYQISNFTGVLSQTEMKKLHFWKMQKQVQKHVYFELDDITE